MKIKTYATMLLVGLMATACSQTDTPEIADGLQEVNITLHADEPAPASRFATVEARYRLVLKDETDTQAGLKVVEQAQPTFSLLLNNKHAYTLYAWADNSGDDMVFDDENLVAWTVAGAQPTENTFAAVAPIAPGGASSLSVTLHRNVAKIVFKEKDHIDEDSQLAISFTHNNAFKYDCTSAFNKADVEAAFANTYSINDEINTTAADPENLGIVIYTFASATGELVDITVKLNDQDARTITNVPLKGNYVTTIQGEFCNFSEKSFSISVDDQWTSLPEYNQWD